MSALSYREQYDLIKSTYSSDPFNIPEKLYAYVKANNIEGWDVHEFLFEVISEVPYGKSYADLTKIPQGADKKIRTKLTDLLSAFCMDPDNGDLKMKKDILLDLSQDVIDRIDQEYAEYRRLHPPPPRNNSNSNNSNIINLRRFGVTTNNSDNNRNSNNSSSSNEYVVLKPSLHKKPALVESENESENNTEVPKPQRRGPIPPPPLAKSVTTENKKANESNYNWSSDNNSGSTYTSNGEGGVWRVSRRKPLTRRRLNYAQNIHGLPRPTPSEPPKGGSRKTRRRRRVQNRRR